MGFLATTIRQEKEIKGIQNGKEKVKLSLFADDMVVYLGNPIDANKKVLNLVSEFGKIAGFTVNIQKSKACLYPNNERSETEIKKKIPFSIATRKLKYRGIKYLNKEVKICSQKMAQHSRNKLRKTQINESTYCVHELEELISLKYQYYPKHSRNSK